MRYISRKVKTIILISILNLLKYTSGIVPINTMQFFLKQFSRTPLRNAVYNVWSVVLLGSGHRIKKLEWSETFWKNAKQFYLVGEKLNVFSLQVVLDRLRLGDLQCDTLLAETRARIYQDGDANDCEFLQVVEAIYEIEKSGRVGQNKHMIAGQKQARQYFQYRMERAHAMRNEPAVAVYAEALAATVSYSPKLIARVCERILEANNLHETAIDLLDIALAKVEYAKDEIVTIQGDGTDTVRAANVLLRILQHKWRQEEYPQDHSADLQYQKAHHLLELKRYDDVQNLIDLYHDDERFKSIRAKKLQLTDELAESEVVLDEIVNGVDAQKVKSDRLGELAEVCEEQKKFEDAIALYRASHRAAPVDQLNIARSASWRYVSALMSLNLWTEARAVLRETQVYMWQFFRAFLPGHRGYSKIKRNDFRLPEDGGLILGCWGIGDELFRMGVWNQIANKKAKWALTCEPRLESVFKRSFPDMEIIVNSRTRGPHAVTEYEYWKDREGLPANTDFGRITKSSLSAMKRYKNVLISEVFLYEFVSRGGHVENKTSVPLLTPDPDEIERVQEWLSTLPEGINVAISWRSGQQSSTRDKNYTQLNEWGDILTLPGINFINIQYSDREEEKEEVRRKFHANVFDMPGVDRKHDIETILAICKCCDVVIAPCTAVREMAGAVGAETWSLTTTPFLPDLWRISEDGETDKFFSTMRHFTSMKHGSKFDVLKAIANELAKHESTVPAAPAIAHAN